MDVRSVSNMQLYVRREAIAACMTCPLCNKIFREATTISECLHTFCRKCIYKKLSDEELECCPICNIDLGCAPLEKLRPDHNLQDVRVKIFPYKRRKVKAPEVAPSVTLPVKRKERSLSSLVVNTPRVSTQTVMTGRRSKAIARKVSSLRGSSFPIEKPVKKEEDAEEDHPESSSSPQTPAKFTQNIRPISSNTGRSSLLEPEKESENGAETWERKADLWKPLNFLVEVANRSKSSKYTSQGSVAKSEPLLAPDSEGRARKTKAKEHGTRSRAEDEKDSFEPVSSGTVKPKKLRRIRRKKEGVYGESGVSAQAVLDAAIAKRERRLSPVWFSLVSCEGRDGNVPVSFIQKYLMRKLDLTHEDEVEIRCMGQPVVPTLQLNTLVDLWLQTASTSQRVSASIGSSAKDFVMVLAYARRVPPS
ncbi:E3 ubiquitin protein ligase DRIP2-like isoform X2 [Diospyros lotus]|uniref:E3 ubiquitin protein ligase DRIP2-like isoform X2 n=1 Tax=Diospyros lotus TaxID=55363 RepID=UPI002253F785|nr:E3 ubiquitin protein ligase DRIP2-like isoform X2 [Diospyros lotus]